MKNRAPRLVYVLLIAYIAISFTYHAVGAVSLVIGYFDLRGQVKEPFQIGWQEPVVTGMSDGAKKSGLEKGDAIEALNGVPFKGRAQFQAARWYARPGEFMKVQVRRKNGTEAALQIPLAGYPHDIHIGEAIFLAIVQILIPLFCLLTGYWIALARPFDPNAWFLLVLLSYPEAFISASTFNWWPGWWLALRLYWHVTLEIMAPAAILWFGLLFPERSRIDIRVPWLKWLMLSVLAGALVFEIPADYTTWYDLSFFPGRLRTEPLVDLSLNWITLLSVALYWIAIFAKRRTASTPDARRRLNVLCAGSGIGLGSALITWGLLPRFGISPADIHWLAYVSAALLLIFPLTLAYVVVVDRAMDVRILIRTATRYFLARTTLALIQVLVPLFLIFRLIIPAIERHRGVGASVLLPIFFLSMMARLYLVKRSPATRVREWIDRKFFREAYNAELVLSELAERVQRITDPAALIDIVSERVSEVLHITQMAVLLRSGGGFRLQHVTGVDFGSAILLPEESAPVQQLVRTNKAAVLYRDHPAPWFMEASGDERRALDTLQAEVLIPLPGRDKLMGVMVLGPKRSDEPYSASDLRLLSSVAAQAGLGLQIHDLAQSLADEASRHQRIQREVEIAREVQERLFPQRIPVVPGVDIAGRCRPALGVGGDYYDVIQLEDGSLGLAIGDVSGKGIAAALLMASLRASLRGMTDGGSHDLARMMRKLNRLVYESSAANRYATFFFAIFDPTTQVLRYVNAGHNPPMVAGRAEAIRLEACGPVIGLLPDVEFVEQSLALAPGDLFIGYTDGISEAMTVEDEEWGEERLLGTAEPARQLPCTEIIEALFEAADAFTGAAPQYDDMTLLLLRVL